MTLADLIAAIESIAPPALAEPWDNTGLILGDAACPLRGPVLLTIDLTAPVADEAIRAACGAVISYHPPIFEPIRRLTAESPRGGALLRLARAGIAVYSPHTALDAAEGGLTDWLMRAIVSERANEAAAINAPCGSPIIAHAALDPRQALKLVTFVPEAHADRLREALAVAGAGRIGEYDHCSFALPGTGSFRGSASSNPAVGRPGRLEFVSEVRLEMVCAHAALPGVIAALRRAHPYEEPAFEVHALQPIPDARRGPGRVADLPAPTLPREIAHRVKAATGSPLVTLAPADADRPVRRVACVPGSGGALLAAARAAGAECFVTGEMKHHDVLAAVEQGASVILAGHTETERPYLPILAARLRAAMPGVAFTVSSADRAPASAP